MGKKFKAHIIEIVEMFILNCPAALYWRIYLVVIYQQSIPAFEREEGVGGEGVNYEETAICYRIVWSLLPYCRVAISNIYPVLDCNTTG